MKKSEKILRIFKKFEEILRSPEIARNIKKLLIEEIEKGSAEMSANTFLDVVYTINDF